MLLKNPAAVSSVMEADRGKRNSEQT